MELYWSKIQNQHTIFSHVNLELEGTWGACMTILLFHKNGKGGSKGSDLFKTTHQLRAEMKLHLGSRDSILLSLHGPREDRLEGYFWKQVLKLFHKKIWHILTY